MRLLRNLTYLFLGFLIAFLSVLPAYSAQDYPAPWTYHYIYFPAVGTEYFTTPQEACASAWPKVPAYVRENRVDDGYYSSSSDCRMHNLSSHPSGATPPGTIHYTQVHRVCPSGVDSGGMCINVPDCPDGKTRNSVGVCADPPPQSCAVGVETTRQLTVGWSLTNDVNQSGREISFVPLPEKICLDGCINNVSTVSNGTCLVAKLAGPPYRVTCGYTTVSTSSNCDLSYVDETANPQIPCPSGTLPGEVNGVRGCFKNGFTTETKTEETDSETGTKTTTTERTNPDGSKTTTTTITNTNGTSTTTITTTPPPIGPGDGSGDSPEEKAVKDKIKDDLCKTDPDKCGAAKTLEKTSVEELYEKKTEKTVESVITDFKTRLADSALGASVDDFFDITISGSCPVWSVTIPYLDATVDIDHFCSDAASNMLNIAGSVLMIVFAYSAFRIAIL